MRRLLLALLVAGTLTGPADASGVPREPRIEASPGTRLLTSAPLRWDGDFTATAVAAEGDHLFLGTPGSGQAYSTRSPLRHGGFLTYRLSEEPPYARQVATFACPSSREGGMSVWDGLLVQSVDPTDPQSHPGPGTDPACAAPELLASGGLRIVDVRDAARPRQVGFVPLSCGARNQALLPAGGAAYIYTLKDACHESAASADTRPARLRVVKLRRTSTGVEWRLASHVELPATVECLGWGVHVPAQRAVCYGRDRLALFDVADPANPELIGLGAVPGERFYAAAFTPDGRRVVTVSSPHASDCAGSADTSGVVRTFAVGDLLGEVPVGVLSPRSTFAIPRTMSAAKPGGSACFTTSVHVLAGRTGRVLAVVGWNTAGLAVLDLTAEQPREIAHFSATFDLPPDALRSEMFSAVRRAVWYRGRIYAPELMDRLGLRVLEVDGLRTRDAVPQPRSWNPQTWSG